MNPLCLAGNLHFSQPRPLYRSTTVRVFRYVVAGGWLPYVARVVLVVLLGFNIYLLGELIVDICRVFFFFFKINVLYVGVIQCRVYGYCENDNVFSLNYYFVGYRTAPCFFAFYALGVC